MVVSWEGFASGRCYPSLVAPSRLQRGAAPSGSKRGVAPSRPQRGIAPSGLQRGAVPSRPQRGVAPENDRLAMGPHRMRRRAIRDGWWLIIGFESSVDECPLLHRKVQQFRCGLLFKAHRLYVSLNSRLAINEEKEKECRCVCTPMNISGHACLSCREDGGWVARKVE